MRYIILLLTLNSCTLNLAYNYYEQECLSEPKEKSQVTTNTLGKDTLITTSRPKQSKSNENIRTPKLNNNIDLFSN